MEKRPDLYLRRRSDPDVRPVLERSSSHPILREKGSRGGLLIDAFGNDWYREQHRIVNSAGDGWIYYSFLNPATGRDESKASYLKSIDWDGTLATIGAGIYRRDLPGTCRSEEVNAMGLDADPSKEKLQEFVRLRRDGAGVAGILRRPIPDHRSALGERLDLLVRRGLPTEALCSTEIL